MNLIDAPYVWERGLYQMDITQVLAALGVHPVLYQSHVDHVVDQGLFGLLKNIHPTQWRKKMSDIHYKINPKVPTEPSIQVGCWLCNGTGAIKEMHIHDGQLYNCHEICYQEATQFIRDQIDDDGFGGEE